MTRDGSVIVASHRRSGTHLTIDLLLNNVQSLRGAPLISLDRALATAPGRPFSDRERRQLRGRAVVKTHTRADRGAFFGADLREPMALVDEVFETAPVIYVWRHAPDVFVSLFMYWRQVGTLAPGVDFSSFLRQPSPGYTGDRVHSGLHNVVDYWLLHVTAGRVHSDAVVRFDEVRRDPEAVLDRLCDELDLSRATEFTDPRAEPTASMRTRARRLVSRRRPRRTGVAVGLGATGDRPVVSEADLEFMRSRIPPPDWDDLTGGAQ